MATATILEAWCVTPATGTDFGHISNQIKSLTDVADKVFVDQTGQVISATINAIPGLVQAIDQVQADPDQLYLTVNANHGFANSVWPGGGSTLDFHAGTVERPNLSIPFDGSMSLTLWDKDGFGNDDDVLGAVRIVSQDAGNGAIAQRALSQVEGSLYYVTYRVDA